MARPQTHPGFRSKAADRPPQTCAEGLLAEGRARAGEGAHQAAADLLRQCLAGAPDHAEAWTQLGKVLKQQGDLPGAAQAYTTALALAPRKAANHFGLADLALRGGDHARAALHCEAGLALDAAPGEGHLIRATLRRAAGDAQGAVADLTLVGRRHPAASAVHTMLAETLEGAGRIDEAAEALRKVSRHLPADASLCERLARLQLKQGRLAAATETWERMLTLKAGDAEAYWTLAYFYQDLGRTGEAFDAYQKALAIDPTFRKGYISLATLMMTENRLDLAEAIFRFVVTLTPDDASSHHNLGLSLRLQNKYEAAAEAYRQALAIAPDFAEPLTDLIHVMQHFCAWDGLAQKQEALVAIGRREGKAVSPFAFLTFACTADDHLRNARLEARRVAAGITHALAPYLPRPAGRRDARLRVGYVSTDFHVHAVAMLIVQLLERHDRARFEIFAYSIGPDDGSALRRRIEAACEHFVDLRTLGKPEAARRIHADGIDILIDLNGYTQDARVEIFAHRPAPIQVNYLGYPGTMGAAFMDYILVDPFVAPADHARFYDEKLVHLPHCYQPNDSARPIDARVPTRGECGLPETGFVFCCFNNPYKITPEVFGTWMDVLQAVPGSVLWLLESNAQVAANLHREAQARGIPRERLVFAPRLPAPAHLARLKRADLFLDTLPYNAHTTASEALWVGVPLVTCATQTFCGRVAGSLLASIGLPELIAPSLPAYAAKAIALAGDPAGLRALRERLATLRDTTPVFDTARYARNLERALTRMAALRDAGLPPEAFAVTETL